MSSCPTYDPNMFTSSQPPNDPSMLPQGQKLPFQRLSQSNISASSPQKHNFQGNNRSFSSPYYRSTTPDFKGYSHGRRGHSPNYRGQSPNVRDHSSFRGQHSNSRGHSSFRGQSPRFRGQNRSNKNFSPYKSSHDISESPQNTMNSRNTSYFRSEMLNDPWKFISVEGKPVYKAKNFLDSTYYYYCSKNQVSKDDET